MSNTIGSTTGSNAMAISNDRRTGALGAKFQTAERIKSGIKEASDVVALPGDRLLVVGDTADRIGLVDVKAGTTQKVTLPGLPNNKPSQLEGVAYDPRKHNLLVSREESHEIWRYDWNPDKKAHPSLKKKFDVKHLGGPENKGIEGLSFMSGDVSPTGRPQLLGVKEAKPRQLLMFDDSGSNKFTKIELEKQVLDVCKDLSAVAIDPKSGHVFISSDESSTVAELKLEKKGNGVIARLVQSFALRDEKEKPLARIEGLTFNESGDLFVLTENDGDLLRLARK